MEAATTLPPPIPPQHMRALAQANRVRLARASLKQALAAGDVEAAQVVRECPWEAASMAIAELLCSQRRWGHTRARKLLRPLCLSETRVLGQLTQRQRGELARALEA